MAFGERREAWDAAIYWQAILPLTGVLLAAFGYLGSRGAWRWPCLVFGGQLAALIALAGGQVGNLFPLGVVLFLVLAGFGLIPTYVGVAVRRGRDRARAARYQAKARAEALLHDAGRPPGA